MIKYRIVLKNDKSFITASKKLADEYYKNNKKDVYLFYSYNSKFYSYKI